MHNKIFSYTAIESKHRSGLLGAYFDCFVRWMQEHNYSHSSMIENVESISNFGKYLKRRGINDIHRLEGIEGQKLFATYRRYWKTKGHADKIFGIRLYIRALEEAGIIRNSASKDSLLFHETQQYVSFLKEQKGLSEGTIYKHKYWVEKFLRFLGCQKADSSLPCFGIADVDKFIEQEFVRLKRTTQQIPVGVLRGFFRFLYYSGKLNADLSYLVTSSRCYRLESLTRVLRWDEVQKILNSVNRSTKIGLRDYAILILISTCGVRASEVSRLKLENINWRKESIYIAPGKTGKELYLPLLPRVGKAILEYLKRGRPPSKYREIFLLKFAPLSPLKASGIARVVDKYINLAGLSPPRHGAHLIRHSFASYLKSKGVPLKQIGDLLGHQDPESTHIYTKTATEQLQEVALEIPEV